MPNYEQFKQAWNSMGNAERRKYTEQYKNDSQFQQFANQYSQEMKNQDSSWVNNQNNASNMNGWTNTQQDTTTNQNQTNANETNWQKKDYFAPENITDNSDEAKAERKRIIESWALNNWVEKSVVSEDFDSSRLTNPNAEVSVKEWTAAQTWMPDYQADSDARDNEIVNNLNSYYNTNKSFFTDRDTFNKTFHYSERNDRQKALLDSFWKGKEDKDKAAGYTTGSSITQGFDSAQITPDIMNYIREYNPEAYAEWQKAMQDEVNKRIANFAVPRTATQTADIWQDLVKQLWLEQWDPYQIYDNWYGMCESLGVFAKNRQLDQYIAEMEQVKSERTAAIQRTMQEWAWRKSQSLINAEVAKTSALYDTRFADLQNQYNAVYNQRQQNLAIANQSAQALQMQGQEDSRVFNNKLAWLGFAMKVDDYRTPEQQAQLWLQTAAIQADLNLLNQSKSNDLALYNKYATAQLENRLSSELSDLNVKDENQLRSNLNNILSQYYSKYWDIIQRSQPQVVDDILKYAKENWISVAEALTKNFIEPLQSKQEYKNMIAKNYADPNAPDKQSWTWKDNWDGTTSLVVQWVWEIPEWLNRKQMQQEYSNIAKQLDYNIQNTALALASSIKDWTFTWWCWEFVNDYLLSFGITNWFWDYIEDKERKINQDYPTIWSVVIADFGIRDKDNWKLYWHVWIVTWINADWSIVVTDSNWDWKKTKTTHTYSKADMKLVKWYYNPAADAKLTPDTSNTGNFDSTFEYRGTTYDFTKYSWWKDLTDDERQTVENLLTYQTDPASLPKSWKDNWASNQRVRAAASAIGRDAGYSERKFQLVKNAEKKWDDAALPWWVSSANSTSMSILKAMYDSYSQGFNKYDINTINRWINDFKAETWDPTVWTQYATSRVAASEIAKALKGWASATEQEVEDMKKLLNWNMWNEQAMAVFQSFAKNLYEKNESEAKKFAETTWYKPNPIWTDEAAEWMATMGIDLSKYYNYEWVVSQENNTPATSYSLNFTSKYKK